MKTRTIIFSTIFFLAFSSIFAPRAFADGFSVSAPVANQMVSETGIFRISWSGTVASSNSYSSSDTSAKILHIYIYPYGATSGPSAMEIGSVNADTARTLDWNVPMGVVGYFGRAPQYQLIFSQNGQTSYSSPFFLWDSSSPLWNPTTVTSSNTSTSQSSATTYASPNFQVNSAGVYVSADSTSATTNTNPVYTYSPVSTWVYRPIDAGVWATTTSSSVKSSVSTTSSTATPSTTVSTSGCIDLKQDLYLGIEDMAADVTLLQKYLLAVGHFDHTPTGFYGLLTQAAVQKFQGATGISQTGYAGPLTRVKIKSLTCQ